MKKSAFTLIELLVVIVIIGILATIGVAQYNEHTERARTSKAQAEARDACTVSVASCLETGQTGCQTMSSCIVAAGLIEGNSSGGGAFSSLETAVPDASFRAEIAAKVGKVESEITESDLAALTGYIDFSNDGISDITGVGYLTGADSLHFVSNSIATVPSEIGNLTDLTWLNLSSNNVSSLPSEIGNMTSLTQLQLDWNNVTSIPTSIENYPNMVQFKFSQNDITSIPSSISNIGTIFLLDFDDNVNLNTFPTNTGGATVYMVNIRRTGLDCSDVTAAGWNPAMGCND